ncbi:hypothetical protein BTJ39_03560 [Izhakiella australiensis]|uniref:IpaD/SipD/SspD family type III secretion system needle tip protein n=1 Tax=Izhakiella australiensis TaxID=1926881 RepID=A0A1S8YPJ8_9GAMM|nr:IpaD/SipD/SspD family type III secretion system needle tip protein [Izhakiella australiensis]OON41059.1 hypothetical protein BTJ39_03560 [Izhakiella australiensis]
MIVSYPVTSTAISVPSPVEYDKNASAEQREGQYESEMVLLNNKLFDHLDDLKSIQPDDEGNIIDAEPAEKALGEALSGIIKAREEKNPQSSWEIYEYLSDNLTYLQENYMDCYSKATGKYQDFMSDFNKLKTEMSGFTTPGKDDVKVDLKGLYKKLKDFKEKWEKSGQALLQFPADEKGKETAEYWKKQLGIDYKIVDGKYTFLAKTGPIDTMMEALKKMGDVNKDGEVTLSMARFNEWQNSINSANSTVESDTQIMSQKFSQANTIFNNLTKILSSTIDALYQTDKEFLRN